MTHPDFAEAVAVGEIGDRLHLLGGGIAGRAAFGLERERHDRIARHLVAGDGVAEPDREAAILEARRDQRVRIVIEPLVVGIAKARRDIGDGCGSERQRPVLDAAPLLLHLGGEFFDADLVDENLDARLVDVVAPAVLIVHAQDGFDVAQQIALGEEWLDGHSEVRDAPEPSAHRHREPGFAGAVPVQPQADVVDRDGGAVVRRSRDRDLELARQEREFGMHRGVLAHDLRPDAGVLDLVRRDAGPLIGGDVANGIAARLDAVQPRPREIGHRIGQLLELDPMELDVLPRGEVAVAAVIAARHVCKRPQLLGGERSVGNADPQHVGVQLQIDAVEQA